MNAHRVPIVLIAEDDLGDRVLLEQAFAAVEVRAELRFATNGEEFLDYLHRRPPWEDAERPDLILLDLNMPRMDGREVLQEIKRDAALRALPVVVLTSSVAPEDVEAAYECGANIYIPKPHSLDELTEIVRTLCAFWFQVGMLPGRPRDAL